MATPHTPGPWYWILNPATKTVELESAHGWRTTIFRVVRWGMRSATLQFNQGNIMENAIEFGKPIPGREHHKEWALQIDHPDAKLIAAAPDLLECLKLAIHDHQVGFQVMSEANKDMGFDPPRKLAWVEQAEQAIQKATQP